MSISYPLNLPGVRDSSSIELITRFATSLSESPFSLRQQVYDFGGDRWEAIVSLPLMERADAEQWVSFLLKLRGQVGTFYLGDPMGRLPQGVATGTPLVDGSGQTGTSLNTKGWTPSTAGILKAGDYVQINTSLYKVLIDAESDASGNATLELFPTLREAYSNNTALQTINAKGLFRLADSSFSAINVNKFGHYSQSFKAIEAI